MSCRYFCSFVDSGDAIPDIQNMVLDHSEVSERAFFIWKRYGNPDAVKLLLPFYSVESELLSSGEGNAHGSQIEGSVSAPRQQ